MPAPRRKNLLASRRRRHDDGEDEGSLVGDFEDDSLSEGSAVSNGDDEAEVEGSDSSGDDHEPANNATLKPSTTAQPTDPGKDPVVSLESPSSQNGVFKTTADTEAMLHGLGQAQKSQGMEEIQFNDLPLLADDGSTKAEVIVPRTPRHETPAQRSRREHQEYIRQRNANPAFVPTRGGFFLHDDRNSTSNTPNARPFVRGRGRGYGPPPYVGYVYSYEIMFNY